MIKIILGHDRNRSVGCVVSAVDLLPGNPRLPRTLADRMTPWPTESGALLVKARFVLGPATARDAFEHAKAFGTWHCFSIGYKVRPGGARHRGGVHYITDLNVYEASPVPAGAHRHARLLAVKSGQPTGLQVNVTPVVPRQRAGLPRVVACSTCGQPMAGVVGGGLRPGESHLRRCVAAAGDDVRAGLLGQGTGTAVIRPGELAEVEEITTEEEYERALTDEVDWELDLDGEPHLVADDSPRTGRAWTRRPLTPR